LCLFLLQNELYLQTIWKAGAFLLAATKAGAIRRTAGAGIYTLRGTGFYFGSIQRGGIYDEMTTKLSQYKLNILIKEIELYKVKTGTYPQNLKQVTKDESDLLHFDPILEKICWQNENKDFYYKYDDNHYELFSVGFDKTPYTNDDVFPNLKNKSGYKQKKPSR